MRSCLILIEIYENEGISLQQIVQVGGYDKGTVTEKCSKAEYFRLCFHFNKRKGQACERVIYNGTYEKTYF